MKSKNTIIAFAACCLISVGGFAQNKKGSTSNKFPTKGEAPVQQTSTKEKKVKLSEPQAEVAVPVEAPAVQAETNPQNSASQSSEPETLAPAGQKMQRASSPAPVNEEKSEKAVNAKNAPIFKKK